MLVNNVVLFAHLYNRLVINKNIGEQSWFVLNTFKTLASYKKPR